jgi:hypothetical protein
MSDHDRHRTERDLPLSLAGLIGPLGLLLFAVLALNPGSSTALRVADLGLGLQVLLGLATHLAFYRRRQQAGQRRP